MYRIARWLVLLALLFVMVAALRKPEPIAIPLSADQVAEKAKQFESKLAEMQQAHQRGETPADVHFSADDVNAFVIGASQRSTGSDQSAPPQLSFEGGEAIVQTSTVQYGRDIYLTLRGTLGVSDGYLAFVPTGLKVGRLSIPASLVSSTLQKKLAEPENRSKLKLPEFIADLRVEDSQLVVKPK